MKLVRATASGVIPAFGLEVTEGDQFWVPDDAVGAFEEVKSRRQAPSEGDIVATDVLDLPEDGDPHSATSDPATPPPAEDEPAAPPASEPPAVTARTSPTNVTTSEE